MIILRMAIIRMVIVFGTIIAGAGAAIAAPYADIVIDARTGKVLHESSPDRKLHPASLTKMMTLYLTFEAVTSGRLSLDRKVKISRHAAAQPASKIGLRAGQRVKVRDLIRAAAVKSANDAATALAEAIGGSERRFGDMMTAKARKLGMMNSRFLNANGLTQKGHYSTARDMALLGRALFYDYPQYYNLFGRTQTRAMGRTIRNTNRRLLASYRGADGIKTGFTNAAGFNLVSSAERGGQRVIAVVFGGRSSASRNARIAELLDLGFRKAPRGGKAVPTSVMAARNGAKPAKSRVVAAVKTSPKPMPRPEEEESTVSALLAEAGNAIVPAAKASENPIRYTKLSPRQSPMPRLRPDSGKKTGTVEIALAAPAPRPASEARAAIDASKIDWAVQLGVFTHKENAIAELASATMGDVSGLERAGREVDAFTLSGRPAYRARLTGFDRTTALAACAAIRGHGKDCLPVAQATQ